MVDLSKQLSLLQLDDTNKKTERNNAEAEELRTAPLFTSNITALGKIGPGGNWFPQYGLLGLRCETYGEGEEPEPFQPDTSDAKQNLLYVNVAAPHSTFICGSQGSGKSHTLSCLLENALLKPNAAGEIQKPLSAVVFHYDKFTSFASTQVCEAAWLCTAGIPVRVLVSPSNLLAMKRLYGEAFKNAKRKPEVHPLYFTESQLNIAMMKTLMGVGDDGNTPLYMDVVMKILREMAREAGDTPGLRYSAFKSRIEAEKLLPGQAQPLKMRLQLLESFLATQDQNQNNGQQKQKFKARKQPPVWKFDPGSLTIVDLSCPFVAENDACALFNICLSLFLEDRSSNGRIIALDEAHKFLTTQSTEAKEFTETLLSIIRQQRHLAARVVIATQEPTLSPKLLDLCNVTIVHKFSSPAWYSMLEKHLAAATMSNRYHDSDGSNKLDLFKQIVRLRTGEALLFCSAAVVNVSQEDEAGNTNGGNENNHCHNDNYSNGIIDYAQSSNNDGIIDYAASSNDGIIDYAQSSNNNGIIDYAETSNNGIIDYAATSNDGIIDYAATSNNNGIVDYANNNRNGAANGTGKKKNKKNKQSNGVSNGTSKLPPRVWLLGPRYMRVRIRSRISADGGRSIMAI